MLGMAATFVFEYSEAWGLLEDGYVGFYPPHAEPNEENLSYKLPVYPVGAALRDESLTRRATFRLQKHAVSCAAFRDHGAHTRVLSGYQSS